MKQIIKATIGGTIGAGVGWLIYRFVGCSTGACPITSNPVISMLFCGTAGLLIMLPGTPNQQKEQSKESSNGND